MSDLFNDHTNGCGDSQWDDSRNPSWLGCLLLIAAVVLFIAMIAAAKWFGSDMTFPYGSSGTDRPLMLGCCAFVGGCYFMIVFVGRGRR